MRKDEVTLVTQDGRTWTGKAKFSGAGPRGALFHLGFISTPGMPWSFKATLGDDDLVVLEDKIAEQTTTYEGGTL